ncbi:ribonuclease PH [Geomicrobium halophilum]|uniref:Ribonuclease PH n=1 Tax=Geomicrobium halophilum TaxID=549000 RepID=A0A841PWG4_9BACL|nr:ribonuclease PH [Geomicrobium halophilum]MBB6448312.1 ribonuclease PH [Geomicrobium halophilum]
MRADGREKNDDLRSTVIEPDYVKHPEGSVLISVGDTKVICSASVEERVPSFMRGQGKGWITAEYAMLPRATEQRNIRESSKGKVSGRTMEIQRLIGRALRSVIDLESFGERTLWVDCDVIQADGGTRTAAITGAFVASTMAFSKLEREGKLSTFPVTDYLAAVSVGIDEKGETFLDLCFEEDSAAAVDVNVVMTRSGQFVEIQGTGEEATFSRQQLDEMLRLAEEGIRKLIAIQKTVLESTISALPRSEEEVNET